MDGWCRELAAYLEGRLGRPVRAALDPPWQERERMLVAGQAHLGWICGLPYVRLAGVLEPLAAPVMAAPRYQNRPVYFSDVVVRREDPFRRLEDLRGAAWAYNEPNSHSGYGVVRCELAGIDPEDVEVRVTDQGVTIRGQRRAEEVERQGGTFRSERFYGSFSRTVSFPVPVDSDQARATFRHGLLEIRAPKRNPDAGRDGRRLNIETPH